MRLLTSRRLWVALLVVGAGAALPPDNAGNDANRVPALVKQLGDEEFHKREAASRELKELGEKALPAVVAAGNSDDPEVRHRAIDLVGAIMRVAGKSKSTGMKMMPVRVREFEMGSLKGEAGRRPDETLHGVRFTRSFLLGTYEVTQSEYEQVMKTNPSWFTRTGGGKDKIGNMDTAAFPVEQVTWFDAINFCNRLSKLDGFEPYYKIADEERDKDGVLKSATVTSVGGTGYRLPTEAEWEFACRAGTTSAFHFGVRAITGRESNFKSLIGGGYGGPDEVLLGRTNQVGSYKNNRIGLFDMHGNVAEWCWDWYDKDYYANSPAADPHGPNDSMHRVMRGGSWLINNTSCRSASRAFQLPTEVNYTTGFRVARNPY